MVLFGLPIGLQLEHLAIATRIPPFARLKELRFRNFGPRTCRFGEIGTAMKNLPTAKPKSNERSGKKIAAKYDEFKEFDGRRYTGMKVGRSHKWYYDKGEWKE